MRNKLLATTAALFMVIGTTSAATVFDLNDLVVDNASTYTTDAFTGTNLSSIDTKVSLDSSDSLEATLKGYNSTDKTGNQSFSFTDGNNSKTISGFTQNTETYVLEFNASGGDVSILDLSVIGDKVDSTPSGIAPGAGIFSDIPVIGPVLNAVTNFLNGIWGWLSSAWAA